ncbi:MAG: methylglyoxal synthase [Candidatus Brocadiaceae bacterium]|nr:methylglyoxal synthase [Candidatus Brocadiaceae bacterium]
MMSVQQRKKRSINKQEDKTLIGVFASYDSITKNNQLARTIENLYEMNKERLKNFHFIFTGGTFNRVVLGSDKDKGINPVKKEVVEFLLKNSTRIPSRREGGVTTLANFVVNRQCRVIWPFLDPAEPHWLNQENLALMRLCDVWKVKRLMNSGSVMSWFGSEAPRDIRWNQEPVPLVLKFPDGDALRPESYKEGEYEYLNLNYKLAQKKPNTIALIAHDDMKTRMIDFAVEYQRELSKFSRILATGTTGRDVTEATCGKLCITRCQSGPKGGDIQIAIEILAGRCDFVIFFVDPLHPHPHAEDIRVVFGACMIQDQVRMFTNEVQAREWIEQEYRSG